VLVLCPNKKREQEEDGMEQQAAVLLQLSCRAGARAPSLPSLLSRQAPSADSLMGRHFVKKHAFSAVLARGSHFLLVKGEIFPGTLKKRGFYHRPLQNRVFVRNHYNFMIIC
jgi:hypothetical protein